MNPLDDELKRALQRKEPSADFEGKVMRRIRSLPPPGANWWEKVFSSFILLQWRWAVSATIVCLGVWVGVVRYQKEQDARLQGEKAKEQVMLALHIASSKLNVAQKAVLERNAHVSQP